MSKIIVTRRDGAVATVEAVSGQSLMEILRNTGFADIAATCGGSAACGTCHVYLDQATFEIMPPPGHDENDLLGALDHRRDRSRLSCQIKVTAEMREMRVVIAPNE